MNRPNAARIAGITLVIAALYSLTLLGPGLAVGSDPVLRQTWLAANMGLWSLGWLLWMVAVLGWMILCVTLIWGYAPVHRVTTMLQSGLMIIAAVFALASILIWMGVLPVALAQGPGFGILVETLALTLAGAGLMMGGAVTVWIPLDLARLGKLPGGWMLPGMVAGACAFPSPLLLPQPALLFVGALLFVAWCGWLGTRSRWPDPFPAWL